MLHDITLFPEGPPEELDFTKQFTDAVMGEEPDPFFKLDEEQMEKLKKKIKKQQKLEREKLIAEGKAPPAKKKKKKKKGKKGKKKKKKEEKPPAPEEIYPKFGGASF